MYKVIVWDFKKDIQVAFYWCETEREARVKSNEFAKKYHRSAKDHDRYEISYEQHLRGFNRYGSPSL